MKKKFKHSQQMGLPGGPNEVFTYTTGVFSSQGYKSNSPDVNNPFNIIPSRHITMKEDNGNPLERYQQILGIGSNGDSQIMTSGNDYTFQRGPVLEIPIAQNGIETGIQKPGDGYEYRKEGDNFYTRKEGKENWTKASGTALDHIKYKIYGEGEAPKKDYSRVINRMRSILPDINSHDFSTEAYWSPGGEFDQLSPERQAYAEYGNLLGRGEIDHDPNSPEGKAFEKYARRIASPEAWMKLYPQTMGQIFDPTNDPSKFKSIKKSWGDATPFDVELSMMDKTSFDPVNVQDAKSQGVAYQQDAQMYDQINKESDIVQQKEKDEAADASEKLRMETGVDRFGNAVPQWELAAYNNPNINSPDDYYNYLQRGGLEVEAGQYFGAAAELTQVPGMYRTIKRVGDEGFKPLVSDVLNTGADVLSTIGEGVYEAGDYAFGDGSFDMSGKNYITGKDKWTGLDRTLDALGFVPFAGAFGAGGKLLRTGSKLKNVAGAGTKAAVGKVFKPVQKLVDKASDIKVGQGYLGEYAPTIGEGAGFINKNVLKKNLNPFSKGPKYTTWDGLKHKGMYGTIMGDNTIGDVVSGDFNATKSNLLRPFIVGANELDLIGDERKTQDVQNVIDQGVQVSDVAKTGLNFSGAPINKYTFKDTPYFGKLTQKVFDAGLQMGGSTSAQNGKETKKDYAPLIRRMNDLLPAQTYGTADETYFSYELPKLLEKRPHMEAIINFGYELNGIDMSTLTPQEKKDLANSEAGQAFVKYAKRLASPKSWMTLYPNTMSIFFDPDNDPNKFKSLKKKWGKYSAVDVEALGVNSTSFDEVNIKNIKRVKDYNRERAGITRRDELYSQSEKEKRDAEYNALEEQDKLERGIGQPFELYNYNAGQKVFNNNEEYYAWKNNEGDYSLFQNPLAPYMEALSKSYSKDSRSKSWDDIQKGVTEGLEDVWDGVKTIPSKASEAVNETIDVIIPQETQDQIGQGFDTAWDVGKQLARFYGEKNLKPALKGVDWALDKSGVYDAIDEGIPKLVNFGLNTARDVKHGFQLVKHTANNSLYDAKNISHSDAFADARKRGLKEMAWVDENGRITFQPIQMADQQPIGLNKEDAAATKRNLNRIRTYLKSAYGQYAVDKFNKVYGQLGMPRYTDNPATIVMKQLPDENQQNRADIFIPSEEQWRKDYNTFINKEFYDQDSPEVEKGKKKYGDLKMTEKMLRDKYGIRVLDKYDKPGQNFINFTDRDGNILDVDDWTLNTNAFGNALLKDEQGNPIYDLDAVQRKLTTWDLHKNIPAKQGIYSRSKWYDPIAYRDDTGYHYVRTGRPSYDPLTNTIHVDKSAIPKSLFDHTIAEWSHAEQVRQQGKGQTMTNFITGPNNGKLSQSDISGQGNTFRKAGEAIQNIMPSLSGILKASPTQTKIYQTPGYSEDVHQHYEGPMMEYLLNKNIPIEDLHKYIYVNADSHAGHNHKKGGEILSKKLEEEIDKIMAKEMPLTRKQKLIDKLVSVYNEKSDVKYKKGGSVIGGSAKLYKDYINNVDNSMKARKVYDKLNRVYYAKAKNKGVSPQNYIMTHVIGS